MKIVKGYSIWLKPSGAIKRKLASLMLKLSAKFKAPEFADPHITLIEGLTGNKKDLIFKTSQLAKSIRPFQIELTKIDSTDKTFKSLVILVKRTKKLMNAHSIAKRIFSVKNEPKKAYVPHLTLVLKDITPKQRKEIIKEIGQKFNLKFKAKSIYLVPIGNNPQKWISVKRFNLKK